MKSLFNILTFRSFCLVFATVFCLAGCGSTEQEAPTPQQNDAGVVDMNIKSTDATEADKKTDASSATPNAGSGSSKDETESSSGLSLTPPKS